MIFKRIKYARWVAIPGFIHRSPVTLSYICKLNEFVARNEAFEMGALRTGIAGTSGTDYMPHG